MSASIKEILALADVDRCLMETGVESTHGHCHNACTWLIREIKKAGLPDYNVCLCVGTFWGKDHSWLLVEDTDTEEQVVVDMTVNQFVSREVPYSAAMTDEYQIRDSINLCSPIDDLVDFIERLG